MLVYLAQPQKLDGVQNFLNAYRGNGGKWDITGLSSYAQGSNVSGVLANMKTIQSTYGKPIMHVEFGGPVGKPTQVRDSLRAFITGIKGDPLRPWTASSTSDGVCEMNRLRTMTRAALMAAGVTGPLRTTTPTTPATATTPTSTCWAWIRVVPRSAGAICATTPPAQVRQRRSVAG